MGASESTVKLSQKERYAALTVNTDDWTIVKVKNPLVWDSTFSAKRQTRRPLASDAAQPRPDGHNRRFSGSSYSSTEEGVTGAVSTMVSSSSQQARAKYAASTASLTEEKSQYAVPPADLLYGRTLKNSVFRKKDGTFPLFSALANTALLTERTFSLLWVTPSTDASPHGDEVVVLFDPTGGGSGGGGGCASSSSGTALVWFLPLHLAVNEKSINEDTASSILYSCGSCHGVCMPMVSAQARSRQAQTQKSKILAAAGGGDDDDEYERPSDLLPLLLKSGKCRYFHLLCNTICPSCSPVAQKRKLLAQQGHQPSRPATANMMPRLETVLLLADDTPERASIKRWLSAKGVLVQVVSSVDDCIRVTRMPAPVALIIVSFVLSNNGGSASALLERLHERTGGAAARRRGYAFTESELSSGRSMTMSQDLQEALQHTSRTNASSSNGRDVVRRRSTTTPKAQARSQPVVFNDSETDSEDGDDDERANDDLPHSPKRPLRGDDGEEDDETNGEGSARTRASAAAKVPPLPLPPPAMPLNPDAQSRAQNNGDDDFLLNTSSSSTSAYLTDRRTTSKIESGSSSRGGLAFNPTSRPPPPTLVFGCRHFSGGAVFSGCSAFVPTPLVQDEFVAVVGRFVNLRPTAVALSPSGLGARRR